VPPLPGGDARCAVTTDHHQPVSIHAPVAGGRCADAAAFQGAPPMFQSTPPVAGGRCRWSADGCHLAKERFNPRPPLPGDDALFRRILNQRPEGFQSTPPVAGGRCVGMDRRGFCSGKFQSTPPVAGGRCLGCAARRRRSVRFQSTPPVAGGRCVPGLEGEWCNLRVSIHAPRCRGTMPD